MIQLNKQPWVINLLGWCKRNNYSNVPEKVLMYLHDSIVQPMVNKATELTKERDVLKMQVLKYHELTDELTRENGELRVAALKLQEKVTLLTEKVTESYPIVTNKLPVSY